MKKQQKQSTSVGNLRPSFSQTTYFKKQSLSPTNSAILQHHSYRRLYNIVHSHQEKPNTAFRNNLIKQLYFLLQIVPIIEPQLIDHFLSEIQKWYDSNDHKKIKLASKGLEKMVKNSILSKDRYNSSNNQNLTMENLNQIRAINPVLRPYTAKKWIQNKNNRFRPQSSQKDKSTNLGTEITAKESYQFNVNIEEEIERSSDFIKKFRTIHPQQEPVYEQLLNLVNRPLTSNNKGKKDKKNMQFKRKNESQINYLINSNNTRSFLPYNSLDLFQFKSYQQGEKIAEDLQIQKDIQEYEEQQECHQQEDQNISDPNYNCKAYSKNINFNRKSPTKYKRPLTGFTRLENLTDNQKQLIQKLNKMTNDQYQDLLAKKKEDQEIMEQSLEYVRSKSKKVKNINRKIQTNRILKNSRNIKSAMVRSPFSRVNTYQQNQTNKGGIKNSPLIINLQGNSFTNKQVLPKYNVKQFFKNKVSSEVAKFKKFATPSNQHVISPNKNTSRLLQAKSINNHDKFNPISLENVQMFNQDVLNDITKIKQKTGGYAIDTNTLMRALYIDSYDKQINDMEKQNKDTIQCEWKNMSKHYLMIRNGLKKKTIKRKKRILKKTNI